MNHNASSAPPAPAVPQRKAVVFARRLTSTLTLWAVVGGAMATGNRWLFFLLLAALLGTSVKEWIGMFGGALRGGYAWCLSVASVVYGAWLIFLVQTTGNAPLGPPEAVVGVGLLFALFWVAMRSELEGKETLWKIFSATFGFFYIVFLGGFMLRVLLLPHGAGAGQPLPGVFYLLFVIAVTKMTDTGAYVVGSLIGKHKLIPHISPGKTWEGLLGAFLGAFIAAHGIVALWGTKVPLIDHGQAAILAVVLAIVTVVADLAESVVKRCLSVKDSGSFLPGIGGALDLVDSLLFTAPLAWAYLYVIG